MLLKGGVLIIRRRRRRRRSRRSGKGRSWQQQVLSRERLTVQIVPPAQTRQPQRAAQVASAQPRPHRQPLPSRPTQRLSRTRKMVEPRRARFPSLRCLTLLWGKARRVQKAASRMTARSLAQPVPPLGSQRRRQQGRQSRQGSPPATGTARPRAAEGALRPSASPRLGPLLLPLDRRPRTEGAPQQTRPHRASAPPRPSRPRGRRRPPGPASATPCLRARLPRATALQGPPWKPQTPARPAQQQAGHPLKFWIAPAPSAMHCACHHNVLVAWNTARMLLFASRGMHATLCLQAWRPEQGRSRTTPRPSTGSGRRSWST